MSKEVLFLLGDKDNNPNHSTLNRTKGSMLQDLIGTIGE